MVFGYMHLNSAIYGNEIHLCTYIHTQTKNNKQSYYWCCMRVYSQTISLSRMEVCFTLCVHCACVNTIFTPQSSTQDLGVEPLLVFADLRRVTLWPSVNRVYVHHRALAWRILPQRLLQPCVIPVTYGTKRSNANEYSSCCRSALLTNHSTTNDGKESSVNQRLVQIRVLHKCLTDLLLHE